MKPLSLEFTAFGSYPGTQTIDFVSLADLGLYVVTGPTGAGKTTIFDAMAYALYGEVPGVREKGDIRSQHADADATCSVRFRFEINDTVYEVARTPEQWRPSKRGGGGPVKVTATASLTRVNDDHALESGATKVSRACAELVGLDEKQFERVVLLPQGRFQQFLLADTATRLPLLRQLFGTGKWLTVVDELKARSKDAKSVVDDIQDQLRQHTFTVRGSLDAAEGAFPDELGVAHEDSDAIDEPDESESTIVDRQTLDRLEERYTELDRRLEPMRVQRRELSDAAAAAQRAYQAAVSIVETWNRRVELEAQRADLDERLGEVNHLRAKRDAAREVVPLLELHRRQRYDADAATEAKANLETALDGLAAASNSAGLGDLRDPDAASEALVMARIDNDQKREAFVQLASVDEELAAKNEQSIALATEKSACEVALADIAERLAPIEAERVELGSLADSEQGRQALVAASTELVRWRAELAEVGSAFPAAQAAAAEARNRQSLAFKAFDESAAPRLAESLVEGEPCPVCGSPEHPTPAVSSGGAIADSRERDEAVAMVGATSRELERLGHRQETLLAQLGDAAHRSLEELRAELQQATDDLRAASDAKERLLVIAVEVETAGEEKARRGERLNEIAIELAGIEPQITALNTKRAEVAGTLGPLADVYLSDPTEAMASIDARSAEFVRIEQLVDRVRHAAQSLTSCEAAANVSRKAFETNLSQSPYSSILELQEVVLPNEELDSITVQVEKFEEDDRTNRTLLDENLKIELPTEKPDVDALEQLANEAKSAAETFAESLTTITGHFDFARSNLDAAVVILEGSADATDRAQALESLAKTCDGQGPKKVALETWVLAGELERVAAAANHHLGNMTNGRYQLERSDDAGHAGKQSGLDLRILDAHTGSSRRPGSLSGGEQFQASLALALGLADVIGHGGNANGRVFEALFVDEGFGSLDPDSLDHAVDALAKIQAGGRTVGVITHVEAMKESLPIGIRVDRLPSGKGSRLVVRPND